jgi:outer membrane protein assembly factor BamE (lipoprotein component of BamABCDE complex)
LFVAAGCEQTVINRGYIMESVDFKQIKVGHDTAASVYQRFGSPTMRSSFSSKTNEFSWYYVHKRLEKNGFLDPKVVDHKMIIVTFDPNMVVKSVKSSTYEKPVQTVSGRTETKGQTKGIFGETFGGLGKYRERYKDK